MERYECLLASTNINIIVLQCMLQTFEQAESRDQKRHNMKTDVSRTIYFYCKMCTLHNVYTTQCKMYILYKMSTQYNVQIAKSTLCAVRTNTTQCTILQVVYSVQSVASLLYTVVHKAP